MNSKSQLRDAGTASVRRLTLPSSGVGAGSIVQTLAGDMTIEDLTPGTRLIDFDRGVVRLRAMSKRFVRSCDMVRIMPGALRDGRAGTENTAFLVAAQQKIVLKGWMARAMYAKPAVVVTAASLVDGILVQKLNSKRVMALYQLHFEHNSFVRIGGLELASTPLPALECASSATMAKQAADCYSNEV